MTLQLGKIKLGGERLKTLSATLHSILEVIKPSEFLIIVPVFNIKDAWNASKIAKAKLSVSQTTLICCIPYKRDYICVFSSIVEPKTNFPVYKASSERGRA